MTEEEDFSDLKRWFTITEVSEMLEVQPTVLRYWETEFEEIKPVKNKQGKRLYKEKDIALLKKIHFLLKVQKYTIKGAKEALKNNPSGIAFQTQAREVLLQMKKFLLALKAGQDIDK